MFYYADVLMVSYEERKSMYCVDTPLIIVVSYLYILFQYLKVTIIVSYNHPSDMFVNVVTLSLSINHLSFSNCRSRILGQLEIELNIEYLHRNVVMVR